MGSLVGFFLEEDGIYQTDIVGVHDHEEAVFFSGDFVWWCPAPATLTSGFPRGARDDVGFVSYPRTRCCRRRGRRPRNGRLCTCGKALALLQRSKGNEYSQNLAL